MCIKRFRKGVEVIMIKILRAEDIKLSPKAQAELDELQERLEEDLKPMYDELGVDIKTEQLMWVRGEVYVIDANGKRRELDGTTQEKNNMMWHRAVELSKKVKEGEEIKKNLIVTKVMKT